jgi:arylsulfatase A-like enzyme
MPQKNVIILTIDSLRPDRLGCFGNRPTTSPFIDGISSNSLFCTNAFTAGNPTEFAVPALFASSRLLDYGGYAQGISHRPATLAEAFEGAGYDTTAFFSFYRPSSNRYGRGFRSAYHIYDINVLLKDMKNVIPWYQKMHAAGKIEKETCLEAIRPYLDTYFQDAVTYCERWMRYLEDPIVPKSLIMVNYDFGNLHKALIQESVKYEGDKRKYIADILEGDVFTIEDGTFGLGKIIVEAVRERIKKAPLTTADLKVRSRLLLNLRRFWKAGTTRKSRKAILAQSQVKFFSTGFIFETFQNWFQNRTDQRPFYCYLHLLDVHELNVFSYDLPGHNELKKEEIQTFKASLLERKKPDYQGHMLYDASIRYVDFHLKRLFGFLDRHGALKDTIIVITADHGHMHPNIPARDNADHVEQFFDQLYRIPLFIYNASPQRYDGLVSSLDLAPTLLNLVGAPIPSSFAGKAIGSRADLNTVVLTENQGRGPCDLERKPVYVCARSLSHKVVCKASPPNRDMVVTQAYNLENDPEEYHNLADKKPYEPALESLILSAKTRLDTLFSRC